MTITNSSQLSTFSMIRSVLLSNSILSKKFNTNDFYEFEPNLKSNSFNGFPYIIINVPEVEDLMEYQGDTLKHKEFTVEIILDIDYEAKDNYTTYASSLLVALEGANSTYQEQGYSLIDVKAIGKPEKTLFNQKQVLEGNFELVLQGEVKV